MAGNKKPRKAYKPMMREVREAIKTVWKEAA